jgi:superfamily II DNA or RNA helicase
MVKAKTCGSRPSKNNQNVYTRVELNQLALKKGLTSTEIKKLKKDELCKKLGIKWVSSGKKSALSEIRVGTKLCSSYKKSDLVKLAIRKLKYTEKKAQSKTMKELCSDLSQVSLTPARKSKKAAKPKKPVKPKTPVQSNKPSLHAYQQKIVDYLLDDNHRGAIAAFSTGSGKTLTAIYLIDKLMEKDSSYNVIILTPVKQNFENDMIKYGLSEKIMKRIDIMTSSKFRGAYPQGIVKCNSKTILIIDEVHNLKTPVTEKEWGPPKIRRGRKYYKPAIAALKCSSKASKVLLLTATPVFNNEYDTVNLITMVKGDGLPVTQTVFKHILSDDKKFEEFFSCVFLFHQTKHSDENYPSKKEHDILLQMTPYIFRKYKEIYEEKHEVDGFNNPVFYDGVRKATNILLDPTGNELQKIYPLKCIWILDKIKKSKQKTVIYSTFIANGIEILQSALEKSRIKYLEVKGDIKEAERKKIVKEFNTDENVNVLFITKAGCEGLDLKGVRNIIIYESGWNRKSELQIIGRGVRFKSHLHLPPAERHVDIYHLLLVPPAIDPVTKEEHEILSADQVLKQLSIKKEERLEKFEERLKKISLGTKHCG